MSAVDDLIARRTGQSAPTGETSGSAVDRLIASRRAQGSTRNPVSTAVGGAASALSRALDAPGWAVRKAITGAEDTDTQMQIERSKLGIEGAYQKLPHLAQGAIDTGLQLVQDPTMALGVPFKGASLAARGLGLAAKGLKAAEGTEALGPLIRSVGRQAQWGYDVGRTRGADALDKTRSAANQGSTVQATTTAAMQRHARAAIASLTDEQIVKVGDALNRVHSLEDLGAQASSLSLAEQKAFKDLRRLTNIDYALRTRAHGAMPGALPRREGYLPGSHVSTELRENYKPPEGQTYSALHPLDTRTIEREEIKVDSPEIVRAGFDAMAKNLGLQMGAARIRSALGELASDPEVQKLFTRKARATGTERGDAEKVMDAWKAAIGYPRAAIVALTPRHVVNILDLLVNTDPGALPETVKLAGQLLVADPAKYERLTREGREMGALSGKFLERKPFFANATEEVPKWLGAPGQAYAKGVQTVLGPWSEKINKLTWAVDDAAKQVYAKRLAEHGGLDRLVAGGRASRELVDYANVSPLVEKLRYVAPFATFRGAIPGAVLGGVARNPARADVLNRLSGGAMYGKQNEDKTQAWYGPTSDVGFAFNEPRRYARATAGTPVQGAATLASEIGAAGVGAAQGSPRSKYADAVKLRERRYATYGNPVDLKWIISAAAAGVPEAQTVLTELGLGPFAPRHPEQNFFTRTGKELIRQSTGIGSP